MFGCRWAENDRARLSALDAMNVMIEKKLEEISEMTATPTSQLKFLSDAWAQVRKGLLTSLLLFPTRTPGSGVWEPGTLQPSLSRQLTLPQEACSSSV